MKYNHLLMESVLPIPPSLKSPVLRVLASSFISSLNGIIDLLDSTTYAEKYNTIPYYKEGLLKLINSISLKYRADPKIRNVVNNVFNVKFDPAKTAVEIIDLYRLPAEKLSALRMYLRNVSLTISTEHFDEFGANANFIKFDQDRFSTVGRITIKNYISADEYANSDILSDEAMCDNAVIKLSKIWVTSVGTLLHETQHFMQEIVMRKLLSDKKQSKQTYHDKQVNGYDSNYFDSYYTSPNEFPTLITSTIYKIIGAYTTYTTKYNDTSIPLKKFASSCISEWTKDNSSNFLNTLYKNDMNKYKIAVKAIINKISEHSNEIASNDVVVDAALNGDIKENDINVMSTVSELLNKNKVGFIKSVEAYGETRNDIVAVEIICDYAGDKATIEAYESDDDSGEYSLVCKYGTDTIRKFTAFNISPVNLLTIVQWFITKVHGRLEDAVIALSKELDNTKFDDIGNFGWVTSVLSDSMSFDQKTGYVRIKSKNMSIKIRSNQTTNTFDALFFATTDPTTQARRTLTPTLFSMLLDAISASKLSNDAIIKLFNDELSIIRVIDELTGTKK